MAERIKAFRTEQHGVTLYTTAMTLEQLSRYVKVDYWGEKNPQGYQRPLLDSRLKQVVSFLQNEDGIFPTGILLSDRKDSKVPLRFRSHDALDGAGEVGELAIGTGATLWLVDGQHRLYGALRAVEETDDEEEKARLKSLPFTVTLIQGLTRYEEMKQFNIINTRGKRLPTDIVNQHLVQRLKKEGAEVMIREGGLRGEREAIQGKATMIAEYMNSMPGVWQGKIAIRGLKGREKGLMYLNGIVFPLKEALRDPLLQTMDEETVARMLVNYWAAIKDLWKEAFTNREQYRFLGTAGVFPFLLIFPQVVHLAREAGPGRLTKERFADILKSVRKRFPPDFWDRDDGDPLTLASLNTVRPLAALLREALPKSAVGRNGSAVGDSKSRAEGLTAVG